MGTCSKDTEGTDGSTIFCWKCYEDDEVDDHQYQQTKFPEVDAGVLIFFLEEVKGKAVEVYKRVEKEDYKNCCLETDFKSEVVSLQYYEVHKEVAEEEDEPVPKERTLNVLKEVVSGGEGG